MRRAFKMNVLAWYLQNLWARSVIVDYFLHVYPSIHFCDLDSPTRCWHQLYPSRSSTNPKPDLHIRISELSTNVIVRSIKALRSHIMSII